MDNGAIYEEQENTSKNSDDDKNLYIKDKSDQGEICGKQTTQNSNSSPNKFDLPSFKCEICPYESIWKHAVKRHQQIHYKGQNIPEDNKRFKYKCEICSYTTNNCTTLKDHQKLHGSRKKTIKTDLGQSKDPTTIGLIELKQEQREESKNNQEKDTSKTAISTRKKCKYKTNYKVIFESHKKVQLLDNGKEVYHCDLCSFNSVYRQSFLRHMETMHDNELGKVDRIHDCIEEHIYKEIDFIGDHRQNAQNQNNNLPYSTSRPVKSQEDADSLHMKSPTFSGTTPFYKFQTPIARTRRGKYSDVPVKTTKDGLFECEHCSYQTAIRTALVKHQTNHVKDAHS